MFDERLHPNETSGALTLSAVTNATSQINDGSLTLTLGGYYASMMELENLRIDSSLANSVSKVTLRTAVPPTEASGRSAPSMNLTHLMRDIGKLCPNVEILSLCLSPSVEVPIAALAAFFQQGPKNLVSLTLSSAIISANGNDDFLWLTKAIKAATSWKEIRLESCEPALATPSLDPLLESLAAAPALEQVALSGTDITHYGLCTGPSLTTLLRNSTSLRTLTVWGGKRMMLPADVCALVQVLESNTSLRELTLHARGLDAACGRALARCLTANNTLERLILNVSDSSNRTLSIFPGCTDYTITTTLLAKALQNHNRTLRLLSLDYCPEEDYDCFVTEGDSHDYDFYDHWQSDNHRTIDARKNAETVRQAFVHMLHSNPTLEVLWMNIDTYEEDTEEGDENLPSIIMVTPEMEMLLRLNRHGIRQKLFGVADKGKCSNKDWVDAIASQSYDINASFYLISQNPSLCSERLCYELLAKRDGSGLVTASRTNKRQRTTSL